MIAFKNLPLALRRCVGGHALLLALALGVLVAGAACAHRSGLKHEYNERQTIRCRVLGPVDEEVLSFTEKAIVTSFVPVEVLAPEGLKHPSAKLILQRNEMRLYPRMGVGEVWREVGSIQTVEVIVNTKSGEIFLYPPLNIPKSELPF
ncbi:MAG: hypothetical protein ACREIA_13640 [Opitutaceae bacterium]